MRLILISTLLVVLVEQMLCYYHVKERFTRSYPYDDLSYHGYNGGGFHHYHVPYYNMLSQFSSPIKVPEIPYDPAPVSEPASEPTTEAQLIPAPAADRGAGELKGEEATPPKPNPEPASASAPAPAPAPASASTGQEPGLPAVPTTYTLRAFVPITLSAMYASHFLAAASPPPAPVALAAPASSAPEDEKPESAPPPPPEPAPAPASESAPKPGASMDAAATSEHPSSRASSNLPAPVITRHIITTIRQPYAVHVPQPYPVPVPPPYPIPHQNPISISESKWRPITDPSGSYTPVQSSYSPILLSSFMNSKSSFRHDFGFKRGWKGIA